ncbi:helix-turn-helix domain-containing protein [Grimontia marina]|uniref:HTH-type transcriptional activator RhaR n=1 Tax=Grimontia marina TaxID=646534 RepID=A0A128FIS1_9GAMM|nr:helix-turn-helix domain-containing protein [Grimontia marina]CZF86171.1 HTH-type transcriptional activator RhaR [Grimontia marina]
MSWIEVATLFGVIQSGLLAVLFLSHNQLGASRKWLAAMSFALALVLLDSFSYQRDLHTEYPHILGLVFPLSLVFSPLVYGYISHLLRKQIDRAYFWHFSPFVLSLILLIPFYFQSSANKAALLTGSSAELTPWYLTPGVAFVVLAAIIQGQVYLWLCVKATLRTINALKGYYSSPSKITLTWTIALQLALFLFWTLDVVYLILDSAGVTGFPINQISDLMLLFIVTVLTVLGFQKKTLFEPLIQQPEARSVENNPAQEIPQVSDETKSPGSEKGKAKYEKSSLTAALAEVLFTEISQHMESHQSYLDSELSLKQLAEETGHSLHNVSQAINQHQQLNFFDFVNQYRVEVVKAQLISHPAMPIIDIGLHSGFNSKSAFYTAFRKHTGMTPSQFRHLGLTNGVKV